MSDQPELRSSEEWFQLLDKEHIVIRDPDGWDRSNFKKSWNELITREEYENRRNVSTLGPT